MVKEEIYIPQDERTLRRIQRKVNELDRHVRAWADSVMELVPKGAGLLEDEIYIISLFLAQQRRLNLELDLWMGRETWRDRLARLLPFRGEEDTEQILKTAHNTVAARLDSDIQRACEFFCRHHNIPSFCDPVMDWRVAMRYLAQRLHHVASQIDLRNSDLPSPSRVELMLMARDLAADIVQKRKLMLAGARPAVRGYRSP